MGEHVDGRYFVRTMRAILDNPQPRFRADGVATPLARAEHTAHDLTNDPRIFTIQADNHREGFVKACHALANSAHGHQSQTGVAKRLAFQVSISEAVGELE